MSDEEICREYRLAKYPGKQVKILAEENGCSMGTIYNILRANGIQFKSDRAGGRKGDDANVEAKTDPEKVKTAAAAEPEWPPLPAAKPEAAADFDDPGPSSLPDVQDLPEAGTVTGVMKLRAAERRYFLTEPQLMELWFILGQLRGVLDASAEAGKPGEVMKDAVDELESLLRSLR